MCCALQILYIGGIWGFHTHIEMWLNHDDPSKSDAILYFANLSLAIPAGMPAPACTPLFSPRQGSEIRCLRSQVMAVLQA